jgi:hypothetical protein
MGNAAMKKLAYTVTISLSILSAVSMAQNIRATVNGAPVYFSDVQPMMVNGRVMVPLRGVFEQIGANVTWFPQSQMVIAQNGQTEIRLPIGSSTAYLNGKPSPLDSPAILHNGRTLVPLRFTSEALNANVDWIAQSRTVAITTAGLTNAARAVSEPIPSRIERPAHHPAISIKANTVIPFTLETRLSSKESKVGDRFTATLAPPNGNSEYSGLPAGTKIEGEVDTVKAKSGSNPGVIGLQFDRIKLPDGSTHAIDGRLIGLDSKSVSEENGVLTARSDAKKDNLKYVGYGAGAGVLLSILGKGNVLTNAIVGGALGYLFGEVQNQQKAKDVTLDSGSKFGVRLTQDLEW